MDTLQESVITADVTQDPTLLELFTTGCKDMHNVIAKVSFPEELKDIPVEQIKEKAKKYRRKAKAVEFTIFYGGDGNVIAANLGISKKEGRNIYENVLSGLPGLRAYQDYCRKEVMDKGYILLSPVTGHKAFIYDYEELCNVAKGLDDPEYAEYCRQSIYSNPSGEMALRLKRLERRVKESEKQSIDYRIQGRGSMCFKTFSIMLYKYLKKHDLLFKVKYCIPAHDEGNLEAPKEIADEIAKVLRKCMIEGSKPFLTTLSLDVDMTVADHWIH